MSDYKEFEAKTLDAAIQNACDYFNTERGKLEINILEDAKTGIFGIIGSRNAKISARKTSLSEMTSQAFSKKQETPAPSKNEAQAESKKDKNKEIAKVENKEIAERQEAKPPKVIEKNEIAKVDVLQEPQKNFPPVKKEENNNSAQKEQTLQNNNVEESSLKRTPLVDLDQEKLINISKETMRTLLMAIIEDNEIKAEVKNDRLCFHIETENSGLLIGKEGQTLASIEYLAARIISKQMATSVRVQVEVGDYRTRQDQRLHEFALTLAEKVRESGKSASTRPLSAYQRRIVHLALHDVQDVQTRSIGEGSLKRVVLSKVKAHQKNSG